MLGIGEEFSKEKRTPYLKTIIQEIHTLPKKNKGDRNIH